MFNLISLLSKVAVKRSKETQQPEFSLRVRKHVLHQYCSLTSILILAIIAFVISGCASDVTWNLKPTNAARDCTSDDGLAELACLTPCADLATMGGSCFAEPGNSLTNYSAPIPPLIVGWSGKYDAGTQPCPCWEWVSSFSRGYVKFDIPIIVDFEKCFLLASVGIESK